MPGTAPSTPEPPARTVREARRGSTSESGFTLIELLIAMVLMLVIVGTTLTALDVLTRTQTRDQAYAQEVTSTQTVFARLLHDLRQATMFQSVTPNSIKFQMVTGASAYNVAYDCTASDSLGSPYTRCAETQALAPALPAAPGSLGSLDIAHVKDGATATFCNTAGSAPSGSVFFVSNPNIPNTDGSILKCDEAYEREIAGLAGGPTYVQVQVSIPAKGDLMTGGLSHLTTLQSGVFLPNLDAGS